MFIKSQFGKLLWCYSCDLSFWKIVYSSWLWSYFHTVFKWRSLIHGNSKMFLPCPTDHRRKNSYLFAIHPEYDVVHLTVKQRNIQTVFSFPGMKFHKWPWFTAFGEMRKIDTAWTPHLRNTHLLEFSDKKSLSVSSIISTIFHSLQKFWFWLHFYKYSTGQVFSIYEKFRAQS